MRVRVLLLLVVALCCALLVPFSEGVSPSRASAVTQSGACSSPGASGRGAALGPFRVGAARQGSEVQ